MDNIYRDTVLDHYHNPRNWGALKKPHKSYKRFNPLCGDVVQMDLAISKGKIETIKFSGEGCVLSRAASSMLTEYAKQKQASAILALTPSFMLELTQMHVGPTRLKCILLPLEVLQKCLQA